MNQNAATTFHDTSQSLGLKQICALALLASSGAQYTFFALDPTQVSLTFQAGEHSFYCHTITKVNAMQLTHCKTQNPSSMAMSDFASATLLL